MGEHEEQVKKQVKTGTNEINTQQQVQQPVNVFINQQQQLQMQQSVNAPVQTQSPVQTGKKAVAYVPPVFSEGLKLSLSLLADDKNKASEFFKPVIESAKKVLSGCESDEALAKEMGRLMENVFFYLDNRTSSIFSPQRRARRAACEKLITDMGRFLYDAGSVYADQVRISVTNKLDSEKKQAKGKKNGNKGISRADEFSLDYAYIISFEAIESKLAKETFMGQDFKAKSKDISAIRHYMEGLNAILTNTMPPVPRKKAKAAEKKAYEDEIRMTGLGISKMYKGIIDSCNNALADASISEEDKKVIRNLLKGYDHDNMVLANSISQYVNGQQGVENITWADAVASKSSTGFQLKSRGVERMGDGTSVVYKYTVKGETKFFKESEIIGKNTEETWNMVYSKKDQAWGYRTSFEEELKKLDEAVKAQFGETLSTVYNVKDDKSEDLYQILFRQFYAGREDNLIKEARRVSKEIRDKNPLIAYLANIRLNHPAASFIDKMADEFFKKYNSDKICVGSAKIDGGNKLSSRNAATSRMADLLGISDMVAHSETVEMKSGGRVIVGNVMDEAEGYESRRLSNDRLFKYTDKAVNKIAVMQLFDMICGQVDRNRNNFFVNLVGNYDIDTIKMIDNDLSFGKIKLKKGKHTPMRMMSLNNIVLDAVPLEFVEAVKKLDTYSAEDLKFFFGDILKDDEVEALKDRISDICNAINEREAEYSRMEKEGTEKEKKIARHMKDNKFRAIKYQYEIYKKWDEAYKKIPKDQVLRERSMFKFTYMNPKNMRDYAEIERSYKRYIK